MIFNSVTFLIFFAAFLLAYFSTRGTLRLVVCLVGSYIFYGWWDWRFLSLILLSTLIDYFVGLWMADQADNTIRKRLLILSLVANLGLLGLFKYYNFFIDSFQELLAVFGIHESRLTLNLILPVGISFYTFQTMSYSIDLYRRAIEVERNFIRFATFVAFFPQLVAGPIVRAKDVIPQFKKDHPFDWDRVMLGLGLILLGYFKKSGIADSLAPVVDKTFLAPEGHTSLSLIIAVFFYAFQIYCDFSGYSDIAIGTALMLGYRFQTNFNKPYFSKNFSEFWQRWHISLSEWLRDYLYVPLGGNRHGTAKTYRNLMITMLLGGLWHGANWTFVFWGGLHGLYLVGQRLLSPLDLKTRLKLPPLIFDGLALTVVFSLTCFAWIFFRSQSFSEALTVLQGIFAFDDLSFEEVKYKFLVIKGFLLIGLLVTGELVAGYLPIIPQVIIRRPALRAVAFASIIWIIAALGTFDGNQFIYFQF